MQVDLGKIKITWKGTYSPDTEYEKDDVVFSDGSSYIFVADRPATGTAPTPGGDNATWQLFAKGTAELPTGSIITSAARDRSAGYLYCDGAAVSRTTYAALFAVTGTRFGAGDGSTTFNIPDLRGEFLRGWDNGRGVDNGRALGSSQTDAFKRHTHTATNSQQFVTWQGTHNPQFNRTTPVSAGQGCALAGIAPTGGTETRPRNIAVNFFIKY